MKKPLKKWQIRLITDPIKPCECGTAIHKRGVTKCKKCRKKAKSKRNYEKKIRKMARDREGRKRDEKALSTFNAESIGSRHRDPYNL